MLNNGTVKDSALNSLAGEYIPKTYIVTKILTIYSNAANDGWALEGSEFTNTANVKSNTSYLRVGDDKSNRQYRSILDFDTSSLPNNAMISSAIVKVKKFSVTGVDPLTTHGNLVADMKKGFFGSYNALELSDFSATGEPINATYNQFIAAPSEADTYQLSVNPTYLKYINPSGATQFRLRFTKDDDNDETADLVYLYAGDEVNADWKPVIVITFTADPVNNTPQLIIEYDVP